MAAVLLFLSCSKSGKNPQTNSLIGNWQLKVYGGGIAGVIYHIPDDSLVVLSFYPDSTFQRWVNRRVSSNGRFHTAVVPNSIFTNSPASGLDFGDGSYFQLIYQVDADTLSIAQNVYDGFGYTYWRVK